MGTGISGTGNCSMWNQRIEERKMKQKIGKITVLFFTLMVVCSLLANGISGALLAKVSTGQIKKGTLKTVVENSVVVEAGEISGQFLPESEKIGKLFVKSGETVSKNQEILQFDSEYLEQNIQNETQNLEKLQLSLEQQKLQGQADARVSETESAEIALNSAFQELQQAQSAYQRGVEEAQAFEKTAPQDAEESEIEAWNQQMDALNEKVQSLADTVQSQANAYETAQKQYELAQKSDADTQANEEKNQQASRLSEESIQVDIDASNARLEKLKTLKLKNGIVTANADGIFVSEDLSAGVITTGSEQIQIATGNLMVRGTITKEQEGIIKNGDTIDVTFLGERESEKVSVTRLDKNFWYGTLESKNCTIGETGSYSYIKESDSYDEVIPLGALRQSQGSYYVLTVEKQEGILGSEYKAKETPVTLLSKDDTYVAIQSTIEDKTKIIISSNKYVEEGDRIRLREE